MSFTGEEEGFTGGAGSLGGDNVVAETELEDTFEEEGATMVDEEKTFKEAGKAVTGDWVGLGESLTGSLEGNAGLRGEWASVSWAGLARGCGACLAGGGPGGGGAVAS